VASHPVGIKNKIQQRLRRATFAHLVMH